MVIRPWIVMAGVLLALSGCGQSHSTDQEYVQRAERLVAQGKDREAVIELKNALTENGANGPARRLLGEVYVHQGLYAAAEKELLRAKALGVEPALWIEPLGLSYLRMGAAASLLQNIPEIDAPADVAVESLTLRGFGLLFNGDSEQSKAVFDRALALNVDYPRARLGMATWLNAQRRPDEAAAWIKPLIDADSPLAEVWELAGDIARNNGDREQAEVQYLKAIAVADYPPVMAHFNLAFLQITGQQLDKAQAQVAWLKDNAPKTSGTLYMEGLLAFYQRDYETAATVLGEASNLSASLPLLKLYLGASHYALGHYEQAGGLLRQFVEQAPDVPQAKRLLSSTLLRNQDFAGAEKVLDSLLGSREDDLVGLEMLAQAKFGQGQHQAGIEILRRVQGMAPDSVPLRSQLALALALDPKTQDEGIRMLEQMVAELKESENVKLILGMVYLRAQRFDDLQRMATELQQGRPGDAFPYNLQALALLGKGDLKGAEGQLKMALRVAPGDSFAGAGLGRLAVLAGRPEEAIRYYQEVLDKNPADERALAGLVTLLLQQGDGAGARSRLKAWVENHQGLRPTLMLAALYLVDRQPDRALRLLRPLEETYQKQPLFWGMLGDVQVMADAPRKALDAYLRLVDLRPDSAQAHYLVARSYAGIGNPAGMDKELARAIELDPTHRRALLLRAEQAVGQGDRVKASRDLKALRELVGGHPEVLLLEAELALKNGRPVDEGGLLGSWSQEASNSDYVRRLAQLFAAQGDLPRSARVLERWLSAQPQDSDRHLQLAGLYGALGREAASEEQLRRVLQQAPDNWVAKNNLAWLLREKDPDRALSLSREALQQAPDTAQVLDTYGEVLLAQGEVDQALAQFQRVAELAPGVPAFALNHARALVRKGSKEEARAILRPLAREERSPVGEQAAALLKSLN